MGRAYIEDMSKIKLSSIVAMAKNNVIGKDNTLLWHIPEDFKHFKRTTMGRPMIMGRKTFESLPGALKGRHHIVITRTPDVFESSEYIHYRGSIEDALTLGREIAEKEEQDEIFFIGGGQIYKETMPILDRLYLTLIERDYEGDTVFPDVNFDEWTIFDQQIIAEDAAKNRPSCTIYSMERKKP